MKIFPFVSFCAAVALTACAPKAPAPSVNDLGGHSMSRDYDWPRILEFAAKWWN